MPSRHVRCIFRKRLFDDAIHFAQQQSDAWYAKNGIQTRVQSDARYARRTLQRTVGNIGEQRFMAMEQTLETGFGSYWKRSIVQREFHNLCSSALAPIILGADYDRLWDIISASRGWKRVRSKMVLCRASRRFGKSVGVAQLTTAVAEVMFLYPLPGVGIYNIAVFSTCARISDFMSEYVLVFMKLRGLPYNKRQRNNMSITLTSREITVTINFFPNSPEKLRGSNADLLIVEEAAYIDKKLWQEVIVPILGMNATTLVMISSPKGRDNFFSRLVDTVDKNGENVFAVYAPDLVCRRCKQKPIDEQKKCRHMMHLMPWWKSVEKLYVHIIYCGSVVR